MTKEVKTQWHPAFCSAMKLELIEDDQYLDYISEYNLNSKPLEIDLLIVKKSRDIEVKNEIGKIFRKHNIIEYKSPDDAMNVNTYLKVNAYACLYKSYEEHVDDIALNDITLTMVRERKPEKLFQWFLDNDYTIEQKYPGIYYIRREGNFPLQVVVSGRLSKENQKWLTLLKRDIDKQDAERIVKQIDDLNDETEKQMGDSVLQVVMRENESLFYEIKEDGEMCEALRELMAPEIEEAVEKAVGKKQKEMIMHALESGSSAMDISKVMALPLEEVTAIEDEMRVK